MKAKRFMFLDLSVKSHGIVSKSYLLCAHSQKLDEKDVERIFLLKEEVIRLACSISRFLEWFFENEDELRKISGRGRED